MKKKELTIPLEIYENAGELQPADALLLNLAMEATGNAYAPYSGFRVGASVRLANGKTLSGTNQENASFPAGICAERVVLSAASAIYPGIAVTDLAISFFYEGGNNAKPISPCGICRQTISEYELRSATPIRLILGGNSGEVFILGRAADLLPLAFTLAEMK
jgi:cytidine deaminase